MLAGRQCVVLVGGKGTRLGALTKERPKPLLSVGGRPFLSYLIQEAARHGFTRILLLAGFKAEAFAGELAELRAAAPAHVEIEVLVEPQPLGTGGALKFAGPKLDAHFLLMNGDSLFDINLLDLTCRSLGEAVGRLALRPQDDVSRYGTVNFDGEYVLDFAEKNPDAGPGLINGGIYWLSRDILDHVGEGMVSLEQQVLPTLARSGCLLGTVYSRFLLDIGLPDTLQEAQTTIPAQMQRPAIFLDRDGVLNQDIAYAHKPEQIVWVDGAIDAVKSFNDAGWYVFVVTNQAGVARGYYGEQEVNALHAWMAEEMARWGAHIDAFAYCPYHPDGVVARYTKASPCRKPAPGMILDLLQAWPVRKDASYLVGDKDSDVESARAAGIPGFLFEGGNLAAFVKACNR
jgi:D,D-heptose 1,7-bisphosphate phosphatase